jgi:signal transduction histidine kinase
VNRIKSNPSSQLRWVVLLLAIAVILPTVCLLWFMVQAVKNERLAVRQKLIDLCLDRIDDARFDLSEECRRQKEQYSPVLQYVKSGNPTWLNAAAEQVQGYIVYDAEGKLIYPVVDYGIEQESFEEVQEAFELEHKEDFSAALQEYQRIIDANEKKALFAAAMGKIRCLDKLGRDDELLELFNRIMYYDKKLRRQFTLNQVAMIRVRYIEWCANNGSYSNPDKYFELRQWYKDEETYGAETTIWALNKIIKIALEEVAGRYDKKADGEADIIKERPVGEDLRKSIDTARRIVERETISLAALEYFGDEGGFQDWPIEKWKAFETGQELYAFRHFEEGKDVLIIRTREGLLSCLEPVLQKIPIEGVGVRLIDNRGNIFYGFEEIDAQPFVTEKISDYLPDWNVQLYFEGGDVFDNAASRQAAVYTWSGALVILLIVICGCIAAQSVSRQIRLNRLKNDFIATVTHELKTPLSSMRVLVDTLLEGNYEGERTATEYLQLISRENERLSHLIDNFLTFSRMERNKQAFEIAQVSPVEIANSAADAVRTKFEKNDVDFGLEVTKPLPMIEADKDAMVTVLVNLLDNAYKYSKDDKRIELKVFREDGYVCFAVKDNGIGMTRRQVKKVFNRFYQADSSLSRRVEGAGLGLSIVKFIVDAHSGKVIVVSRPEKGSTFTVKLKAPAGDGDDINNRR